ncbi:30S ribosomal protein S8 [Pseudohongiella sp. SYSU M77423]|uniref:30S ribosomal protein S8 n=1 Tax=unclassified Pseudohongiella TaxID=2629611 RepID=UPI000C6BFBA3|nr:MULTISPECIES: 30S ribosomal protein S8 [unclassified Pseudohongiella]MAY56897.1 30S ribosomal protein S8 [Gammaproteobacteria bacterium]HBN16253.1 30S ribosomal protein S8 [Pseudohongiella sp.]MBJ56478.1 30S ribosomal protein S8 [Gammaproteobacteria bacterium]MDH7944713.1 30S ribosomal protein S8 [Pseudohongiella sp. SYSU M77423]HBX38084.1 30S ribosomal protein S8 [Pseudohongiella sp.]
MSMSDPIADLLTRIRNAQMARLSQVSAPASKLKVAICNVLQDEGYISGYSVSDDVSAKRELVIDLKYYQGKPVIEEIKRVSRPGLRQYMGKEELPRNRQGLGIVIVSTNKGLMTDKQARAAGIGGEVLCTVF